MNIEDEYERTVFESYLRIETLLLSRLERYERHERNVDAFRGAVDKAFSPFNTLIIASGI